VNDVRSDEQLPDLGKRSDRKLGWHLWKYLRAHDRVPSRGVRRGRNALASMSRNFDQAARHAALLKGESGREANATLETAFRLAAKQDFVAAGAVYRVVYPRLQKRFDEVDARHKRRMNAARARLSNEASGMKNAIKIHELIAKISREYIQKLETDKRHTDAPVPEYVSRHRHEMSSEAIGRRLKIPASTVRRILNKSKNA
jgi:hypothetical protein